jgi:hypothetical protein
MPFACVRLAAVQDSPLVQRECERLTPLVETHGPSPVAILLALGGSERLLVDERSVAATPASLWPLLGTALSRRLSAATQQAPGVAVGIGPTRTLAWLAARQDATVVVLPGQELAFLAAMPLTALLDVPDGAAVTSLPEIVAALEAVGVQTFGQLQRLMTDGLARRFGAAGAALAVLARGGDLRPLQPRVAESWLGVRLVFEPPLAAERLAVALRPLAERLALLLAQRELSVGRLAMVVESETGQQLRVARRLAHPLGTTRALLSASERLLAGLLSDVLRVQTDMQPDVALPATGERYVSLRLRVGGLHAATAEQRQLWAQEQRQAGTERVERLARALHALQSGKYADALLHAETHEPDAVLPEERYRLTQRS